MLRELVYNRQEGRPRCAVRLGLQTAAMALFVWVSYMVVGIVVSHLGILEDEPVGLFELEKLGQEWIGLLSVLFLGKCLAVLASLSYATRKLDHRPLKDLGLRFSKRWWRDFGFGLALGALLMSSVFLVALSAGWIAVVETRMPVPGEWLVALLLFVAVGFYEEMLSRGYQLKNLAEGLNAPRLGERRAILLAWFVSSLLFGLGHGFNPHASFTSFLGLIAAGMLLGLPFVLTGELALSIGLHITWNFFQGPVFGFAVSGRHFGESLIRLRSQGGETWTGGAFGPEAGLLGLGACVLGALLVLGWLRLTRGGFRLRTELGSYYR